MRITELNYNALQVALSEYKKSAYFRYYNEHCSIIENIENDMIDFREDGTIIGEYRICSHCNCDMNDGYVIGDGDFYYCSDKCLYANISKEKYLEMYEEDNAYYTQFY